ncbi:hypothetical protein DM02DRAFT_651240 [Periconia macrospinosa]|uniref:Uncharacterized protein n=1 Tax=Periconia macrospinosa TaxID=97972 RepID=A0A2V1E3T2_9PLEO|nr:hypothetical protein DM02DRAFT_651240 [Periconia macrospinosa]
MRTPLVLLWLWLLTLQCCIQNQRHTSSVEEDAKNKPWRPVPSGRISIENAADLLTIVFLITGVTSYLLGVFPDDVNGVVRNALNAAGFTCFFAGSLKIAIGDQHVLSASAQQ